MCEYMFIEDERNNICEMLMVIILEFGLSGLFLFLFLYIFVFLVFL